MAASADGKRLARLLRADVAALLCARPPRPYSWLARRCEAKQLGYAARDDAWEQSLLLLRRATATAASAGRWTTLDEQRRPGSACRRSNSPRHSVTHVVEFEETMATPSRGGCAVPAQAQAQANQAQAQAEMAAVDRSCDALAEMIAVQIAHFQGQLRKARNQLIPIRVQRDQLPNALDGGRASDELGTGILTCEAAVVYLQNKVAILEIAQLRALAGKQARCPAGAARAAEREPAGHALSPAPDNPAAQVSTRILGRRTAPFPTFLISNRAPHGVTPRS